MNTKEFVEKVRNNEIDIVEHTHKIIKESKKINKEYNYFNTISEDLALQQAKELHKKIKSKDKTIKNKKLLVKVSLQFIARSITHSTVFCEICRSLRSC